MVISRLRMVLTNDELNRITVKEKAPGNIRITADVHGMKCYEARRFINNIINNRKLGKKHHIIINAEGIGHSTSMARRIEAATGVETRATILGYMQRGGSPTCKDRYYASVMGAYAADILCEGKTNRVIAHHGGEFVDFDIDEALAMEKTIDEYQYQISLDLSR